MAFSESIHVKMPHQVSTIYQHINYGIVTSVFIFIVVVLLKVRVTLFCCCFIVVG